MVKPFNPKHIWQEKVFPTSILKEANAAAIKASSQKVVKSEEVKKTIAENPDETYSRKRSVEKLKKFTDTIQENPEYGKNGQLAIAKSPGMRFYTNNVALRLFDKMLGKYDVDNNTFKPNIGNTDNDLRRTVNGGTPSKFSIAASNMWGYGGTSVSDACKKYMDWDSDSIKLLATLYKNDKNASLDSYLGKSEGGKDDPNIDAFRKKFSSVIA